MFLQRISQNCENVIICVLMRFSTVKTRCAALPTAQTPAASYLWAQFILSHACRNSTACCGTPVLHQQNNQRDASNTHVYTINSNTD